MVKARSTWLKWKYSHLELIEGTKDQEAVFVQGTLRTPVSRDEVEQVLAMYSEKKLPEFARALAAFNGERDPDEIKAERVEKRKPPEEWGTW